MGTPVWIEYWPEHSTHNHLVLLDDGGDSSDPFRFTGEEIEDAASELAEAVQICNEQRHQGHGQTHIFSEVMAAYSVGVQQLLSVDFQEEWNTVRSNIAKWKKWHGPVPAAVMLPDIYDSKQWGIIIPDKEGNPIMYKPNQKLFQDIMPGPEEMGARPNPEGIGWSYARKRQPRRLQLGRN